MSLSNLPPGVSESDIPGNRQCDAEYEREVQRLFCRIEEDMRDLGVSPKEAQERWVRANSYDSLSEQHAALRCDLAKMREVVTSLARHARSFLTGTYEQFNSKVATIRKWSERIDHLLKEADLRYVPAAAAVFRVDLDRRVVTMQQLAEALEPMGIKVDDCGASTSRGAIVNVWVPTHALSFSNWDARAGAFVPVPASVDVWVVPEATEEPMSVAEELSYGKTVYEETGEVRVPKPATEPRQRLELGASVSVGTTMFSGCSGGGGVAGPPAGGAGGGGSSVGPVTANGNNSAAALPSALPNPADWIEERVRLNRTIREQEREVASLRRELELARCAAGLEKLNLLLDELIHASNIDPLSHVGEQGVFDAKRAIFDFVRKYQQQARS